MEQLKREAEIQAIKVLVEKRQKIADQIHDKQKEIEDLKKEYQNYKHLDFPHLSDGSPLPLPKKHFF
jgi:hypothetical protein